METTEKKLSLVERFNQVGEPPNARWTEKHPGEKYYSNHIEMRWELRGLLKYEISGEQSWSLPDNANELLQEYKDHFELDAEYKAVISYEVCASFYNHNIQCSSLQELQDYLSHRKNVEEPECWCDDYFNDGPDLNLGYEESREPSVSVSNLKLKQKKFSYSLLLNVECEKEQQGLATAITDLINQSSKGLKVVSCTQST